MKYVYAALLLHAAGQEISEENLAKVLKVTGGEVETARVQALVVALSEVNIDEAVKAPGLISTPVPAAASAPAPEEKKEEEEEEEEEEGLAGLGALFG